MSMAVKTLGKICDLGSGEVKTGPFGSQLHKRDYTEEGVPVVMPKNIVGGKVSEDAIARIGQDDVERLSQHKLLPGDIVYGRRGDIGRHAFVTDREAGWICGTGCLRINLGNDGPVTSHFLHYYLEWDQIVGWIRNHAVGATMPNLNTSILRNVPIEYPPLSMQHQISTILSTYDDLIENNTRRIAILEEMARRIYTEWFVNFRFPGHEKVKMVDSELGKIPNGWEISSLGQNLLSIESGKRPKGGVKDVRLGMPSVGAENVRGIGRHNYQKEKFIPVEFFERMTKGVVKDRDVGLYKDGAYIGRSTYFRNGFPHHVFAVNEHVFLLRTDNKRITQNILYLWLQQQETIDLIRSTNANAAQPGINQTGVKGLLILTPTPEVSKSFDEIVESFLSQIINLAKRNNNLSQTRDLLLPKLISGEIDVSKMEIAA